MKSFNSLILNNTLFTFYQLNEYGYLTDMKYEMSSKKTKSLTVDCAIANRVVGR